MDQLGDKVKKIRKKKGMTQEELAMLSKVNLRTIQRLEYNESEPRGYTLKNICKALGINMEEIMNFEKNEDYSFLSYFYLSILTFFFIPLGNILVPAILWQSNKNRVLHLDTQAKNVINFQILLCLLLSFSVFLYALLKLEGLDLGWGVLLFYFGLNIINIILVARAWAGIKKGSILKYFPSIIKFIK